MFKYVAGSWTAWLAWQLELSFGEKLEMSAKVHVLFDSYVISKHVGEVLSTPSK